MTAEFSLLQALFPLKTTVKLFIQLNEYEKGTSCVYFGSGYQK